ncbi:hypothetical protein NLG42_19575 [Flavobacterium plurextorum]|uniref:hypothetical protein n=1 Tax=Flavobacterium TaxID=237 RepID=UPI00214D692D|nr:MULTISPECIES: hypothetical protein [Flavobacterium]UUW08295.1 hypothetical protein NLG42_19575 [Flavobacterium plurextorum]
MIVYLGLEIEHPQNYIESDVKKVSAGISYFEFYFKTKLAKDYNVLSEDEEDKLLFNLIDLSVELKLKTSIKYIFMYL